MRRFKAGSRLNAGIRSIRPSSAFASSAGGNTACSSRGGRGARETAERYRWIGRAVQRIAFRVERLQTTYLEGSLQMLGDFLGVAESGICGRQVDRLVGMGLEVADQILAKLGARSQWQSD